MDIRRRPSQFNLAPARNYKLNHTHIDIGLHYSEEEIGVGEWGEEAHHQLIYYIHYTQEKKTLTN